MTQKPLSEPEVETFPAVQRLPAVGGPADLASLEWSDPLLVEPVWSWAPSCLALDSDRIVVNWARYADPKPRYMAAVQLSSRTVGSPVPTGFNDTFCHTHERRLAPFGSSQYVGAERAGRDRVLGRVGSVADLKVSLSDTTELGSPCGDESDLYRLDNGLYVVSGRGLCGRVDRPSFAVFRASGDGDMAVVGRAEVGHESLISFLVCRSMNRVGLIHKGGMEVYEIGRDGAVSDRLHVDVPEMSRDDWHWGLGVDLGDGRVAQLYCWASDPTVLVGDLRQDDPALIVRLFHHPKPSYLYRRACFVDGHLIIPGCQVLDVFDARSESPSSWQLVKRYNLPDLCDCGFPCVVGQQLVLLYRAPFSCNLTLQIGRN